MSDTAIFLAGMLAFILIQQAYRKWMSYNTLDHKIYRLIQARSPLPVPLWYIELTLRKYFPSTIRASLERLSEDGKIASETIAETRAGSIDPECMKPAAAGCSQRWFWIANK